jgi:hypothetical protein
LAVPSGFVEAGGRKICPNLIETFVLKTILGLEIAVGLSDIVRSSEKGANPFGPRGISKDLFGDRGCPLWQPIPEDFRSRGNIQQVEW